MKSKKFPANIFSEIERALETECKSNPSPIAAFDADGTLWNTDLGETFFHYQIENQQLKGLPSDPWHHYLSMKAGGNPRPAYLWLAQINAGQKLKQVRQWAQACVEKNSPLPIFEEQSHLIQWLLQQKVKVFVVTASIKWAVEPGAFLLNIPQEQVLGVATTVENGIITSQQDGLMTYREGKAEALLHATNGVAPFFACGNTTGDLHLLQAAAKKCLAVRSAPQGSELFQTENLLYQEAKNRNWLSYSFKS